MQLIRFVVHLLATVRNCVFVKTVDSIFFVFTLQANYTLHAVTYNSKYWVEVEPVSYTHLTLPTIYSV